METPLIEIARAIINVMIYLIVLLFRLKSFLMQYNKIDLPIQKEKCEITEKEKTNQKKT